MTRALWFDEGVDRRDTGSKSLWVQKPPTLQAAIILAANRHGVDLWELLTVEAQQRYLKDAARLVAEAAYSAREGTQGRDPGQEAA